MVVMYKERYFLLLSSLLLILTVCGFSDNLFWDIKQPSNSDPKFLIHGSFCLVWMIMLVVQAAIINTGRPDVHKKVGVVGFAISLGMIVSTVYIFAAVWKGWGNMDPYIKANRILFASFVFCLILAFLFRKKSDWHKRLIIVGTLLVMEPVLSRVFGIAEITVLKDMSDSRLDLFWYVAVFTLWGMLFFSLILYDWFLLKRIHTVTYCSFGWLLAVWAGVHFI